MSFEKLEQEFYELNLQTEKNSMDRLTFCWKLLECDDDKYLETHLVFLEKANNYFHQDLKAQFKFRKDKLKVFQFLQQQLDQDISEKLRTTIIQILEELDFKTLEEYQLWFKEIKLGKRTDEHEFVWSLMKSPYVEYHFDLMSDKTLKEDFRKSLQNRFAEHKEKGAELLLSKLKNNENPDFQAEMIFILGVFAKKERKDTDRVLMHVRLLADDRNDYTRNRAIIVLGWLGTGVDFEVLENHLLNDSDNECRAWSATACHFIYERTKSNSFKKKAYTLFQKALANEKDYFVMAMIIYSTQQLSKKTFQLSQKAIDDLDECKIDLAKEKVLRFISKELKR